MKTHFLLAFIAAIVAASAFGQTPPSDSRFAPELLGGRNPVLNEQEKAGVAITDAWKDKSLVVSQPGVSGSVQFRFDESYPTIVCAVLQVTDIELQAGEAVTHINLGDTTRWTVESALSGSGSGQVEHLIVKPRDIGLSTSLVVTTDRRTYHLLLVSDDKEFMHDVTFLYQAAHATFVADTSPPPPPTPSAPRLVKDPPLAHKPADRKKVAEKPPADDVDENYVITGKADWKPVNAYCKEGKTFIEMPRSARHKDAPVLYQESRSGWFHHSKNLVNYRVHGKWLVVDYQLDSAVLVSGTRRVKIQHKEVASGR